MDTPLAPHVMSTLTWHDGPAIIGIRIMLVAIEPEVESFVKKIPVARLATADREGRPVVVPVCFVLVDGRFYTPIDDKRKRVSWGRLRRLVNIEENPAVSLLIDHYEDDWTALGFVLVRGTAATVSPGGRFAKEHAQVIARLRARYPQYRDSGIDGRPVIKINPERITHWTAQSSRKL